MRTGLAGIAAAVVLLPLLWTLSGCGCADDEREITDGSGETCCVAALFDCGERRNICQPIECSEDAQEECADLSSSERHCGGCWRACGQLEQCEEGMCVPL